jgi:3-dehydroquinate synthetase
MLERLGLPTTIPASLFDRTLQSLAADKKRSAQSIGLPVVRGIGECTIEQLTLDTLVSALR